MPITIAPVQALLIRFLTKKREATKKTAVIILLNIFSSDIGFLIVFDFSFIGIIDIIEINIPESKVNVLVSDEELEERRKNYVQPEPNIKTGWLARYAKLVSSADKGAIML